jgi:hypothetical protein
LDVDTYANLLASLYFAEWGIKSLYYLENGTLRGVHPILDMVYGASALVLVLVEEFA